jgi:hypothetical protein
MVWPARGMQNITTKSVSEGTAPALIVHWAGLKKPLHRNMEGADLLDFFERTYYKRIPSGGIKMIYDQISDVLINQWYRAFTQWRLLFFHHKIQPLLRKVLISKGLS